jgi:hypothetical protein
VLYDHFYVILISLPILKKIYNVKTYINHKTVNAVYTILCKSYDERGRSSNTITNLVVIKQ